MGYTKQNFTDGQVLKAEHLIKMEEGIINAEKSGGSGTVDTSSLQEKLVSGTNIKTINGKSLLGSGNITVESGDVTIDGATLGAKYAGLYGKKVSIIGDSISTYEGYLPDSTYAKFYPFKTVNSVDKTWWMLAINTSGMVLHKNCAWSGSKVSGDSTSTTDASAGCSTKRINDLAKNGVAPDIVICFIGINNLYDESETPIGSWDGKSVPSEGNIANFSEAYALMVAKILKTYPNAEVFLCTLLDTKRTPWDNTTSSFPTDTTNGTLKDYNDQIRFTAEAFGVKVIDMHACGLNWFNIGTYSTDGLHPTDVGMEFMAKKVLADISAQSIYCHTLGKASEPSEPPVTYYTVTYDYVDADGNTIKASTSSTVASGTTITVSTSNAPEITDYEIKSVSPSGSVTVTSNTTITYTYVVKENVVTHTVTYNYVDANGINLRNPLTTTVVSGSTITVSSSTAPSFDGYRVTSVTPNGTITVSADTVITFTYETIPVYTVTYQYIDADGATVKDFVTEQVEDGTVLEISASDAPEIEGFRLNSVTPNGSVTVNGNITITYTYKAIVYRNITYKYVSATGETIKADVTKQVEEGSTLTLTPETAFLIGGYTATSVMPSGNVLVASDMEVTITYDVASLPTETVWYVDVASQSEMNTGGGQGGASYVYLNEENITPMWGKAINAFRFATWTKGTIHYGKVNIKDKTYVELGSVTPNNNRSTTLLTYKVDPFWLSENEQVWWCATGDTAAWYYGSNETTIGNFACLINAENFSLDEVKIANLTVDIGYVVE